ncbi:DUF262 domain-containing protein [Francisella philomiragia]|uniref:DUF262 domain-containing protein n=1 Tax=Francisella philomiragia TaxID=28110 RepID=UPI001B8BB4EA|nr:DUF262 domain-containing protein [Francisella philomiragia]QUE31832.1 DUF262 domain-containing protein [Francisella philomiragia]
MEARAVKFLEVLAKKATFNIPVYQRNYDWNDKQCLDYINSLEKVIVNNLSDYFMGSIVYIKGDTEEYINTGFDEFVIIDGQQRITTTHLFLKALYDLSEDDYIKEQIKDDYLYNIRSKEEKLKLKPIKDDNLVFSKLIKENSLRFNVNSKIACNFKFLKQEIKERKIDPSKYLAALRKVYVVEIILDRKLDDPQSIFESINSTGLGLTQADLIRNYILMDKNYKEQTYLFETYWHKIETLLSSENISDFIRDYLTMESGTTPNKKDVYIEFKKYCLDYSVEEILKKLVYYACIYKYFLDVEFPNSNMVTEELYTIINVLNNTVVYPLLLKIFSYYEDGDIELDIVIKVLKLIVSYLIRRNICSYPTSALNKIFASMSNKDYDVQFLYDDIEKQLLSKKFPNNEEFRKEFANKDIYNINKNLAKSILYKIEKINNKELVGIDKLTLEHIAPQKLTPKWQGELYNLDGKNYEEIYKSYLHTFGNLTLTGYNQELSNKTFIEKKNIYEESSLFINRYFYDINSWGKESVSKHVDWLFSFVEKMYFYPEIVRVTETEEVSLNDDVDVTSRKIQKIFLYNEEYNCDSWIQFLEKFMEYMYSKKPENLKHLASKVEDESFKYISTCPDVLRKNKKVSDNIYFEANLSAKGIVSVISIVCDELGIDKSKIRYVLR